MGETYEPTNWLGSMLGIPMVTISGLTLTFHRWKGLSSVSEYLIVSEFISGWLSSSWKNVSMLAGSPERVELIPSFAMSTVPRRLSCSPRDWMNSRRTKGSAIGVNL